MAGKKKYQSDKNMYNVCQEKLFSNNFSNMLLHEHAF